MEEAGNPLQCLNCGLTGFRSRNHLFSHLRTCSISRNPFNREIVELEAFLGESNGYIFVTGGRVRGKTLKSIERYDLTRNKWESFGMMNENRGSHNCVGFASKLYIIGGGGLHSNLSSGEEIDVITGASTALRPMNTCRHAMSVAMLVANNEPVIYAIGGWADGSRCCDQVEKYRPSANDWLFCSPMPTARRLFGATVFEDRIYCFGGNREDGAWNTNVLEIYSTTLDSWVTGATVPVAGQASAVTIEDFIYVIVHGEGVYRYDPRSNQYETLSRSLPLSRWFCFDCVVVNQEFYLIGGNVEGKWSPVMWKYHPYLDRWTELTPMKQERRRCAATVLLLPHS